MTSPEDVALIRRLREENDELRETLRQLRADRRSTAYAHIVAERSLPPEWPLPFGPRAYLLALSDGRPKTADALWSNAYKRHCHAGSEASVAVQISRARRDLAPLGIEIKRRNNVGYYLEGESLRIVRAAIIEPAQPETEDPTP